jgi:hypothetical protein
MSDKAPHGRTRYRNGCRCDVCKQANKFYMRELRARHRGLTPVPADETTPTVADPAGPVVAAVQADIAALGDLTAYRSLAAAAVAMARILDSDGNVPTMPSAAKQLASLLEMLHRQATPRRSRLAVVQAMTEDRA